MIMEKMEHKIGTRITLEVAETDNSSCVGCFFFNLNCCQFVKCWHLDRTDHKNIIYKEIKEEK